MSLRYSLAATLAVVLLAGPTQAQTTHIVNVTNFVFTPANITIHAGDTVEWRNQGGLHSVQETSENPAGFGNAISGSSWVYSFTFPTASDTPFTYECGQHGPSMPGTVTVQATSSTEPPPTSGYRLDMPAPNPFTLGTTARLRVARDEAVRASVHDLAGREVALLYEGTATPARTLALTWEPGSDVAAGAYLLVVRGESFESARRVTFTR